MTEQRTADGVDLRERIDLYLRDSGLGGPSARVVPLTGDASDRRYFRILPKGGDSFVLAVHAAPFDYDKLPFVNTAKLFAEMPVPAPAPMIGCRAATRARSRLRIFFRPMNGIRSPHVAAGLVRRGIVGAQPAGQVPRLRPGLTAYVSPKP